MQKTSILNLLPFINSAPHHTQNREGWVIAQCPFAPYNHDQAIDSNPSFGIRVTEKRSKYHCFSCNESGWLDYLPTILSSKKKGKKDPRYRLKDAIGLIENHDTSSDVDFDVPDYDDLFLLRQKEKAPKPLIPYTEEWLESFPLALTVAVSRRYLQHRSVPKSVAEKLQLRYDPVRERLCFPTRTFDGLLVGLHGRGLYKRVSPKYYVYTIKRKHNSHVWTGEGHVDLHKTLVLVESVFDMASVLRIYPNVMCSRSCGISLDMFSRIQQAVEVITLYDNGKGGNVARESFIKNIPHVPLTNLLPSVGVSDPGEMSIPQLEKVLSPYL